MLSPVLECAAAGCRFAALDIRSSSDHCYHVRDAGEERARSECHSRCGQLLDGLNSFGNFGVFIYIQHVYIQGPVRRFEVVAVVEDRTLVFIRVNDSVFAHAFAIGP